MSLAQSGGRVHEQCSTRARQRPVFLPTHGDGRHLGTTIGARAVSLQYLRQIAQAADDLGYFGVLLPTGRSCEDSWVIASALAPLTDRLKYLVAVRPGLQSPTVAARMTATLDRVSEGRLLINVVTGGDPVENKGDGIFLDHDERYEVTREFLTVYTALLAGDTVRISRQAYPHRERTTALPAGAEAAAGAVFRWLVRGGGRCRRRHDRQIFDLGRAAGTGRREDRASRGARSQTRTTGEFRHPPARHRARNRRGSLEGSRRSSFTTSATKPSHARNRSLRAWIRLVKAA